MSSQEKKKKKISVTEPTKVSPLSGSKNSATQVMIQLYAWEKGKKLTR